MRSPSSSVSTSPIQIPGAFTDTSCVDLILRDARATLPALHAWRVDPRARGRLMHASLLQAPRCQRIRTRHSSARTLSSGSGFRKSFQTLLAFILLIKCFPCAPDCHRAYATERRPSHIIYAVSTAALAPTTSRQSRRAAKKNLARRLLHGAKPCIQ